MCRRGREPDSAVLAHTDARDWVPDVLTVHTGRVVEIEGSLFEKTRMRSLVERLAVACCEEDGLLTWLPLIEVLRSLPPWLASERCNQLTQ